MLQPFASELSSVFNSTRCSASIRPLTVKITSPFVALVILSIVAALSRCLLFRRCLSRTYRYGNRSSSRTIFKLKLLAGGEMSGASSIAEIPYSISEATCAAGG